MSLFKLTKTLADNFDLFLKDKVLVEGSLKLTPPKSNLSSTITTSGWTIFALTCNNKLLPPLINIGTSALKFGLGSL